jgi:hypothetical protein
LLLLPLEQATSAIAAPTNRTRALARCRLICFFPL